MWSYPSLRCLSLGTSLLLAYCSLELRVELTLHHISEGAVRMNPIIFITDPRCNLTAETNLTDHILWSEQKATTAHFIVQDCLGTLGVPFLSTRICLTCIRRVRKTTKRKAFTQNWKRCRSTCGSATGSSEPNHDHNNRPVYNRVTNQLSVQVNTFMTVTYLMDSVS
jgi:hypothetical protein